MWGERGVHGKLHVVAAVHGATTALWEGFVGLEARTCMQG